LDIVNDRVVALYYQAWASSQIGLRYEGDERAAPEQLRPTDALMGLGLWELISRAAPDAGAFGRGTFRFFTGALACEARSTAMLVQILRAVLALPLRVEDFAGKWLRLPAAQRARLAGRRSGVPLGARRQMLGARAFSAPAGVRIVLGPLSRADFLRFLPRQGPTGDRQGTDLAELAAFVRFFLGPTVDFEVQPLLDPAEARPARLGSPAAGPAPGGEAEWGASRLGLDAFLAGQASPSGPRVRFATRA
jgi:type VI secretion system protein ImpH